MDRFHIPYPELVTMKAPINVIRECVKRAPDSVKYKAANRGPLDRGALPTVLQQAKNHLAYWKARIALKGIYCGYSIDPAMQRDWVYLASIPPRVRSAPPLWQEDRNKLCELVRL